MRSSENNESEIYEIWGWNYGIVDHNYESQNNKIRSQNYGIVNHNYEIKSQLWETKLNEIVRKMSHVKNFTHLFFISKFLLFNFVL